MSKKFEISGNDLIITDTVTDVIEYQDSATGISFNNRLLRDHLMIDLNVQDGSKDRRFSVYSCPLSEAVDNLEAQFTEVTFRAFASVNFNSASAKGALNNFSGGFVDYNDAATSITPIPFIADTQIPLTNDTLGAFTNTSYLPAGVTSIFSSNQFDWSQLSLGDMIDIRMDIDVVTNSQNQEVRIDLGLGIGGNEYEIPFEDIFEKTSGNHRIVRYNGVYMGDANTLDNPAEFRLTSDGSGTVKVNGWYCKITRRA